MIEFKYLHSRTIWHLTFDGTLIMDQSLVVQQAVVALEAVDALIAAVGFVHGPLRVERKVMHHQKWQAGKQPVTFLTSEQNNISFKECQDSRPLTRILCVVGSRNYAHNHATAWSYDNFILYVFTHNNLFQIKNSHAWWKSSQII